MRMPWPSRQGDFCRGGGEQTPQARSSAENPEGQAAQESADVLHQEEHQSNVQCEELGQGVGYACCIFWHKHVSAPGDVWGCASQGEGVVYTFCVVLFGRDVR